jgi:hypothetical protein
LGGTPGTLKIRAGKQPRLASPENQIERMSHHPNNGMTLSGFVGSTFYLGQHASNMWVGDKINCCQQHDEHTHTPQETPYTTLVAAIKRSQEYNWRQVIEAIGYL